MSDEKPIKGRGTGDNPANRFERMEYVADPELEGWPDEEASPPSTQVFIDSSQSIIATNKSPDIPFDASVNPYRGCEHGCIYCYARPTHEYLGFSSGLDFETKIMAKVKAPELLEKELMKPRWTPRVICMSGVTDPYQPVERKLEITRKCLHVLNRFKNPVAIITKNFLVTRDIDVLGELASVQAATVAISITTLDKKLARVMEPRTASPHRRLEAITRLREAGVAVGVMVAPIISGLNDHEIPAIVEGAVNAGAQYGGYTFLRLPYSLTDLFTDWLEAHFPDRKKKVLNRIRQLKGGKLNRSEFGERFQADGIFGQQTKMLFKTACVKYGLARKGPGLSTAAFRRPGGQMNLFD